MENKCAPHSMLARNCVQFKNESWKNKCKSQKWMHVAHSSTCEYANEARIM